MGGGSMSCLPHTKAEVMAASGKGWREGMRAAWKRRRRRRAAIPYPIMKQLAASALPHPDAASYSARLSELLQAIESNAKEKVQ
jgi:hypothetical protein